MSVVVDAGALVELVLGRGFEGPVRDAMADHPGVVHAPELLDLEVMSAVRRLLLRGEITARTADFAIAALRSSPVVRVPHRALTARAWQLREQMSPYDAAYVALAELGDPDGSAATLVTADARLARAVRSLGTIPVVAVPVS